jgi:hypothetical protein
MNELTVLKQETKPLNKESLQLQLVERHKEWKKLRRWNRNWDAGITVSTIILTLLMAILAIEGIKVDEDSRKVGVGILGAIVVAIQSIGNGFPVKQRAGGYKTLEAQTITLENDLIFAITSDELSNIQKQLNNLILEAARLEQ